MKNRLKRLQEQEEQRKAEQQRQFEKNQSKPIEQRDKDVDQLDAEVEQKDKQPVEGQEEYNFDPAEMQSEFDGWELYKRRKIPQNILRRYCLTLDSDYMKHKVTVCAHINHILDLFNFQRKPFMRTYADKILEKQRATSGFG